MFLKQLVKKPNNCFKLSLNFFSNNVNVVIPSNILQQPNQSLSESGSKHVEKISKSMKAYLENAHKISQLIESETKEFELGKRHLANIMGWNFHNITQNDINRAINYLLPSGLFEPKARPVMLPPEEIYTKQKMAEFNQEGRPYHFLFYTGRPNLCLVLHKIHENYLKCNQIEDKMIEKGIQVPPLEAKANLIKSEWLSRSNFEKKFLEKISDHYWAILIYGLEKLASHPYSSICESFLIEQRKELVTESSQIDIPSLNYNEAGRPYSQAKGLRKHCVADVTVWGNGTGKIDINGYDLLYFLDFQEREQIMFPLQFTNLMNKVDIEVKVIGEGTKAQAGAVRHGISLALRSFVDAQTFEEMRLAGLITKDRRVKERKKIGYAGARRAPTHRPR